MAKTYHLDPGYITVPEANRIILRILKIINKDNKSHYNKILAGAKKGLFGGKKYGTRMYQVRREDIIHYAQKCLQNEQLQLFDIEETSFKEFEEQNKLLLIDQSTARNIHYYLKYLKFHRIISDEAFRQGEKTLVMRVKMKNLTMK